MEDDKDIQIPKEFIESIGALNDAIAQQQDSAAAMLYRLMFRHERNINILDRFADQVLDGVCGMGSSFAEEDYLNYLQYLSVVIPHELEEHKKIFDELKEEDSDEDFKFEWFCIKDIENLN